MRSIKDIKKYIKNKKGETSLMFVFSMIFLFWIILFIIDLFRLTYVQLDAVSVVREALEIVSEQGGLSDVGRANYPTQYPSQRTYVGSRELAKFINGTMLDKGIERGDVAIISGNNSTPLNEFTDVKIDYGEEVTIRLRYKMNFISLPDSAEKEDKVFKIVRRGRSKYKHRDAEGWEGDGL